ncbi:FecR domain-containing protein [Nitrosomonas sp.]|uniref:FecR domain-containing protein n=1 Tax=Nitrosomonas sp. TaxID=42353 RepID=UPI0037C99769
MITSDTSLQPSLKLFHQVLEQAAEWFAVLDSGEATATDHSRWEAWLAESAEHREAWGYVERISRRFEPIKASPEQRTALTAYRQAGSTLLRRRQVLLSIAAFAGSGLLGWVTWRYTSLPGMAQSLMADYRTGTGEVSEIALSDGTRVWLNAVSAFNQSYRPDQRCLHLIRGEILIDTATDPLQRPFYVETPQGRLQALGTRFTVRMDESETLVAVYEGAVKVRTAATGTTAIIPAGQQTRFTSTLLTAAESADPAREAWTRGLLVARNIPLSEVVRELRRYHHGHLGLAPEVADLRVFGGYPVNNPDRTLAMLESVMPIRVHRTLPWWVSIEPKERPDSR